MTFPGQPKRRSPARKRKEAQLRARQRARKEREPLVVTPEQAAEEEHRRRLAPVSLPRAESLSEAAQQRRQRFLEAAERGRVRAEKAQQEEERKKSEAKRHGRRTVKNPEITIDGVSLAPIGWPGDPQDQWIASGSMPFELELAKKSEAGAAILKDVLKTKAQLLASDPTPQHLFKPEDMQEMSYAGTLPEGSLALNAAVAKKVKEIGDELMAKAKAMKPLAPPLHPMSKCNLDAAKMLRVEQLAAICSPNPGGPKCGAPGPGNLTCDLPWDSEHLAGEHMALKEGFGLGDWISQKQVVETWSIQEPSPQTIPQCGLCGLCGPKGEVTCERAEAHLGDHIGRDLQGKWWNFTGEKCEATTGQAHCCLIKGHGESHLWAVKYAPPNYKMEPPSLEADWASSSQAPCLAPGGPENRRCFLPKGHKGNHRDGSARWPAEIECSEPGCWKPAMHEGQHEHWP